MYRYLADHAGPQGRSGLGLDPTLIKSRTSHKFNSTKNVILCKSARVTVFHQPSL